MSLPPPLAAAVAGWLSRHGAGSRRAGAQDLTATYRKGGTSGAIDLAAYLVARLPATYAAVARVLGEVADLRPDLVPASLLDAGSGPGTAAWAAAGCWPSLSQVTFLDNAPAFLALATELSACGPHPLARAVGHAGSIEALPAGLAADAVIAAYALAELPVARAASAALGLWGVARQVLVLVEPGTPEGFARIAAARKILLAEGAVPVAPCTHGAACPVSGADWCHFSVRLARSRAHMHAKSAAVPFEDEKFAYLVLARRGAPLGGGRILRPPRHAKPGSAFTLCTGTGLAERHVASRDRDAYKRARKLDWGDVMPPEEENGS